ncbi:MAG: hypothetical protein H3C47_03935 [Candidatus Cloacimonetes bacterium]|nr:hypothetical protein [Candidatus Cloacimonadota bacterium]
MRKLGFLEAFLIVLILGVLLWVLFPSASEIRRLRGLQPEEILTEPTETAVDRIQILEILKQNQVSGPELAFAYLRRQKDEEMEIAVSEYFGRLGDLDRQLLWLLRAEESHSDPRRREQILRLYLQMGQISKAREFLKESFEKNSDPLYLERLSDLGDSRPLTAYMNSRRQNLDLNDRIRLFALFSELQDYESALKSLSPRIEGLWIHQGIVDTCLQVLQKDHSWFLAMYPVLAHAYLYRADVRILEVMRENLNLLTGVEHQQWGTEIVLMMGDPSFTTQFIKNIADTGNTEFFVRTGETIQKELLREILTEENTAAFPEVFTSEAAPALDWPLQLSPRFIRAGCVTRPSFCFNEDRNSILMASDWEALYTPLLESMDPEKKAMRILSSDSSTVVTEELYLIWNRLGVTGKSIPHLIELWQRSGSTRLWSEILDGSLSLGDFKTVLFLLASQKNQELVNEWVLSSEAFKSDPAFSSWLNLAYKGEIQDWYMPLASDYGSRKLWNQASKMWELVAELDKNHKNSRELLAHWNRYHSQLENASRYAKEAVDLGSTDPLLLLIVANDLGAKGNAGEASMYYTSACDLFLPKAVDELVLAFESCHKALNYQKSSLLVERLVLAEPQNPYWVTVWYEQLRLNRDWDNLLKIGSAKDLKILTDKELDFWKEIAPELKDREFQNRILAEVELRVSKQSVVMAQNPEWVIEEIQEKESLQETLLLPSKDLELEVEEIKRSALVEIALRREKEIVVREFKVSQAVSDFNVGIAARQHQSREEIVYTVENHEWEDFRIAYGRDSRAFSIGRDLKFLYMENPLRGYLIGNQEDLRIKEVAIEFSRKIRETLEAELKVSRTRLEGRMGSVEKANLVELGVRHLEKSGFFQEIRVIHRNQSEFFPNRTALGFRDQDRIEFLLGKKIVNRYGNLEFGAGVSLDGSKTSPVLRTEFESVRGLGIYYESSWDPWIRKVVSDYGVHWRQNF